MPCVGASCGQPLELTMKSHGIEFGYCQTHLDASERLVQTSPASGKQTAAPTLTSTDHVHDYVRMKAILQCKPLFAAAMKKFCNEASRSVKAEKGMWRISRSKVDVPLSRALSAYEGLCWFNTQQKIMSGLLTATEFQNAIKSGYMVKDPGPGPDHGEFSHRLQWHYVMRVVTDSFRVPKTPEFTLTPLQLYCGMGDQGFARNIWGALLEGTGEMGGLPGSPAWVNEQFRSGGTLGDTSFGQSIDRRYNKRKELVDYVTTQVSGKGRTVHTLAGQRPSGGSVNVHTIVEFLYKWKKAGPPAWVTSGGTAPSVSEEAKLAAELWCGDSYQKKWQGRSRQYMGAKNPDDSISDGLLLHGSEAIVEEEGGDLNSRLTSSAADLNTGSYRYSSTIGAALRR